MSNPEVVRVNSGGVGCSTILGIVFVVLKLLHVIDWSWWWILAPFWIPVAFTIIFVLGIAIAAAAIDR